MNCRICDSANFTRRGDVEYLGRYGTPIFECDDDRAMDAMAPYDVVYHVGTIGCVADPLGMTKRLLGLLKPGGRLLFNVPNRDGCYLRGQLWIDAAPPPDVVTLFPSGFWRRQ